MVAVLERRSVVEALVAKKLVVVAAELVERSAVKFCKVEEPVTRRLERVVSPPVAVTVPVKLAALEIVWPFTAPEVMVPVVMLPKMELPAVSAVAKRLVEEAVVAKRVVEVAFVEVELRAVKFKRVEELVRRRLERVVRPVKMLAPLKVLLLARSVEEAAVTVMFCEPSKATPLIFLGVWRTVAEPALPLTEPEMV
jgi:hypothetical protein